MKRQGWPFALMVAVPVTLWGIVPASAAPSPKPTLIKKCPFAITTPGAYEVSKDLTCTATAIVITAGNVDLTLGGHTITGDGGAGSIGIAVEGSANVRIHDGTVRNFEHGVRLQNTIGSTVDNLAVTQNSMDGIFLLGATLNTVTGNTATQNGNGIHVFLGAGNTVSNNRTDQNGGAGVVLSDFTYGNLVSNNTANQNGWSGILVWVWASQNTIQDNTASANHIGINLTENTSRNTVQRNTTAANGGSGILIDVNSANNLVISNAVALNRVGIQLAVSATGNTVQANTVQTSPFLDLEDDNAGAPPTCANIWISNTFTTQGGDGAACID
jgi:parallel beta-helix repeat protein